MQVLSGDFPENLSGYFCVLQLLVRTRQKSIPASIIRSCSTLISRRASTAVRGPRKPLFLQPLHPQTEPRSIPVPPPSAAAAARCRTRTAPSQTDSSASPPAPIRHLCCSLYAFFDCPLRRHAATCRLQWSRSCRIVPPRRNDVRSLSFSKGEFHRSLTRQPPGKPIKREGRRERSPSHRAQATSQLLT